jgi:endo-1,4-beta-xylanase
MRTPLRRWLTGSALLALLVPASLPATTAHAAAPVVVASYDFEAGTAQGWFARGGSRVAVTTDQANTGTHSLRTTGRTQTWEGPSVELASVLQTGATYTISAFVRLLPGTPSSPVQVTMQRQPVSGATAFDFVNRVTATDAGWLQVSGSYTPPSDSSQLQVYFESSNATAQYDIDDVTVTQTAPPPGGPPDETGLASDFEDATVQGWGNRGGVEQLSVTTTDAHSGTHSLLTTGRTQPWMGPSHSVLGRMGKGKKYALSVWVKLGPDTPAASLRMSIERRLSGIASFDTVAGNTTVTASAWVQLKGTYTLAADVDFLSVYVESASGTPSFLIDDFALAFIPQLPIQTDIPSLKDVLANDFRIGAAIGPAEVVGTHADLLNKHFNSVTPGNALKWDSTEPAEGQFNFSESDNEVNFATAHGIGVRGHTLVWHSQVPAWVFRDAAGNTMTPTPENKALLLRREENHIRAVMGRYKGKMYAWDVANEVIDEYSSDGLRHSTWYQITGLDYLRTAFRVAHEVDPGAKLFINDYNTTLPRKRDALYRLVSQLLAEGVPIDGVGHQMHIDIEKPAAETIAPTIEAFAGLGLDNQITEMDISVYSNFVDRYTTVPPEVVANQGHRYKDVFDVLRREKAHISSVTVWGLADDDTWLSTFPITRLNPPLLFDEQLQAKPAYWGIVDPRRLPKLTRSQVVPAGSPRVDGRSELEWDLLPSTVVTSSTGLSAGFRVRWDAANLYLLADVNDTTPDRSDGLDVVVDGASHHLGRVGVTGRSFGVEQPGGYRVEASLPLQGAGVGKRIGFTLSATDAQSTSDRPSWDGVLTSVEAVRHVDAVRGTPVIDGMADGVWANAATIGTGVPILGTRGATATARVLRDDQHLYVYATVTDPTLDESSPNLFEQDSVEIFVDPNNAKTSGYEDDDGQYRVSYTNRQSIGGNFDAFAIAGNLTSATRLVPGGYVVEASIALNTITPGPDTLIGFDLQVNDATSGTRTGVVTWNDPTGLSYLNTSRWGVIRL